MSAKKGLPIVAIVGRPNVGKSTFFNRLIGRRKSLVRDQAGVTRDRVYAEADYLGRRFVLVDTGGFEPDVEEGHIYRHVRDQALLAIDEADVILYFADGRAGMVQGDVEVVDMLRQGTDKPVVCVVNKIDTEALEAGAYEFYALGFERVFPVSAEGGRGGDDLLDHLLDLLPPTTPEDSDDGDEDALGEEGADAGSDPYTARIALIGRPNVGKSSLANRLLGEERQVIHDSPGTTRDSIELEFEVDGRPYLLTDTAGVRRAARISDKLEKFTVIKAFKALSSADIAILLIDPAEGITSQEQRLAGMTEEKGKALILAVNKWDLHRDAVEGGREAVETTIREKLPFVSYALIHFLSALTGAGVSKLMPLVDHVMEQHRSTVPTSALNNWLIEVTTAVVPPQYRHNPLRFFYMTQVRAAPPTFVVFVNHPEGVKPDYRRYLLNQLRATFGFDGSPVRMVFRARK